MGNGSETAITGTYDVSAYLSSVDFKTFVAGASLSYNRFRDEIYISNPSYSYSYALSLKHKQWFKISERVWQDTVGSKIINTPGGTVSTMNILDMGSEQETHSVTSQNAAAIEIPNVTIHLQSRPFTVGYQYSHVQRLVTMIRTKLTSLNNLIVALYGSDDLQNWKLLTYSARNGQTLYLSQLRTPPSARSWRYYTICIGGAVQTDTDFGSVLMEYDNVIRRIG